jgi:hypothetical protein
MKYFFDEQVSEEDIPRYQKQYRNERLIEQIKLQASDLNEKGKQVILDILAFLLQVQGLNDESGGVTFYTNKYNVLRIRPIWQAAIFGVQCTRLSPGKEGKTNVKETSTTSRGRKSRPSGCFTGSVVDLLL